MKNKRRLIWGSLLFALLFFYFGVRVYFVFFHIGSYDGWTVERQGFDKPALIRRIDPQGPATLLRPGDEFLAINSITLRQDPSILNFAGRVPPGTSYTMTVRRNGQEILFRLVTVENRAQQPTWGQKAFLLIYLIFLLTGLFVFLLKPDDQQAWFLALMLSTFTVLSTWTMPLIPLSFAYAIIRHKVIPVSMIIRRGVRYLLVSRGAVILEFLTVIIVLTVVLRTIMTRFQASHLVVGIVSGVVSVAVWQATRAIHTLVATAHLSSQEILTQLVQTSDDWGKADWQMTM